jgi:hypothetical protein
MKNKFSAPRSGDGYLREMRASIHYYATIAASAWRHDLEPFAV